VYRVGIDVGGTFTDVVFHDESTGEFHVRKVLTTPDDPAAGLLSGVRWILEHFGMSADEIGQLTQGTTLVSNALIERRGARTGLITTRGFRDVLETRTEKRYDLYDFNAKLPDPLVPRQLRLSVTERIDDRGGVVVPLDVNDVERALQALLAEGVESIAVCFLHSYINPDHERRVREIIERLAPHVDVSLSSDVAPQIREYPRLSTTVANAYVRRLIGRYLDRTRTALSDLGLARPTYVMVSGAVVTEEVARATPVRLVDSGAAAGAVAAGFYGGMAGRDRIISFEMGGTTAKFCFVDDGQASFSNEFEVARVDRFRKGSGLAIALPALDLVEVGAGGGSIAWIDELGLLRIGPSSAGANPGPACYGLGGDQPTVSDANLLLGYLNATYFLGGEMELDVERAREAVTTIATKLAMEDAEAAWGIHEVVTENMVNAARAYVAEEGRDPRSYTLVAFGGAGPAHAVEFARKLGIGEVIVPWAAGVGSAVGSLSAPLGFDFVRTYIVRLDELDLGAVNSLIHEMEDQGRTLLRAAGVAQKEITLQRYCNMRYVGQTHEIRVPLPIGNFGLREVELMREAYAQEYERLYQHPVLSYQLECINWRVFVSGPTPFLHVEKHGLMEGSDPRSALKERRPVYFGARGTVPDCPIYDRYRLLPGVQVLGPAIVEERESTVVIPPGATTLCDPFLNLVIRP
jgi:N-methylhydantoinase A/oxoprolinase/acetone carboxylase beta subunit